MAKFAPASGKTKRDLKDVFGDVGSIIYSATDVIIKNGKITLPSDGVELPCASDSLSMSQSAPSINHYKVVGLSGDWFTTSEPGDLELSLDVPTKHSDILKVLYGEDAVSEVYVGTSQESAYYTGTALVLSDKTITGTFFLVNKEETQIMILNNTKLWATPSFENSSTEPFKFTLSGTIENADGSADTANIVWLKKKAA